MSDYTKNFALERLKEGKLTAKNIIKAEYGGSTNFMTPDVIEYRKINKYMAYELSKGVGFITGDKLIGVTIASYNPETQTTKREFDLSDSFNSIAQARDYIDELIQKERV